MYENVTKMLGCTTVNKTNRNNGYNSKLASNGNLRGLYVPDPAKPTDLEKEKVVRVVKQRVLDEVALAAPKLHQAFQLVPRKEFGKTLVDLSTFATCIRTSGVVLS